MYSQESNQLRHTGTMLLIICAYQIHWTPLSNSMYITRRFKKYTSNSVIPWFALITIPSLSYMVIS